MDSLENERAKQRDRLIAKLAEKKSRLKDPADVKSAEETIQSELEKLNKDFDEKEAFAIKRAQEDVLLALSSIYMDDALLKPVELPPTIKEEDDDDFFEDVAGSTRADEAARLAKAADWLARVDQIKDTYVTASQELQQRLRQAHRETYSDLEADAVKVADGKNTDVPDDTYCGVATHMMKVLWLIALIFKDTFIIAFCGR